MQNFGSIHYVKIHKIVHKKLSFRIFEPSRNRKGRTKTVLLILNKNYMAHHFYKLKEEIRYRFKTRHHKGRGIHSPYLFRLVTSVLQEKHPYYYFNSIESLRKEIYINPASLNKRHFITRHRGAKEARCGQIIFRIIQDAQSETLLELGMSTGLETQYMALANQKARCITMTRSAELAATAQKGFQKQGLKHIELHILEPEETPGNIINELETLDFVLFNQLGSEECLDLFTQCLRKKNNGSIFVFTNIHGKPDTTQTWKKIRVNKNVQVTMDLYNLGIVLFNPELEKRNYVLRTK